MLPSLIWALRWVDYVWGLSWLLYPDDMPCGTVGDGVEMYTVRVSWRSEDATARPGPKRIRRGIRPGMVSADVGKVTTDSWS